MLSKIRVVLSPVIVLAVAISAMSCSLRFNDKVEKAPLNVKFGGCLKESGPVLRKFSAGTASGAELNGFWSCAEKSLTTFVKNTEGDLQDVYKASELSAFLTKYFLGGRQIPPALLHEAMVLKQSLIGGSHAYITAKEIEKIVKLMRVARGVSQKLRPHMPIRFQTFVERNYSPEQFEAAIIEFQMGLAEIGDSLKDSQGPYTFEHFAALHSELGKFMYPNEELEATWVGTVLKWSKALRPAKVIFVSPGKDGISQDDWAVIYRMAPKYYSLYLRSRFYTQGKNNYTYGKGLNALENLFDEGLVLFAQALAQRPNHEITSEEVEDLLAAMRDADLLPMQIDTARSAVKLFFAKLFKVEIASADYTIRKENLQQLARTFHFATEGLRALESFYRAKLGPSEFNKGGLRTEDFLSYGTDKMLEATLYKDQISRESVESLAKSAGEIFTVFPGAANRMLVPSGKTRPRLSLQHMGKMHLMRSVNRLLIGAYAGPKAESLSEAQLKSLLKDIFPILQDPWLALADAETEKTFPSRVFEASLFLPSSDGDKGLTMNEAMEFESLLLSTIVYGGTVHTKLAALCEVAPAPAKAQKIPARCYRKNWLKSARRIWGAVPGLAAYFERLPEREQGQLFSRLENFLRKGRVHEEFTLSDTRSFIQLPYYVEMLFARFDQNHDGYLENQEAELAYPVFYPFLSQKCIERGKTDPEDHHAIYMYLLANRALPDADKMADVIAYGWRRYIVGDKRFKADRGQVVEIFEKLLTL